ncbi:MULTISPECIES: Maf-like protein [unclassified Undibacterium]|uniref:Maf-like protein n=1 Tax=unclassified Undibacterium TaxID=2630295 RepID=UPI002AC95648|nr:MULTISPECIES: Maf-like protein [unclassified Undibacterium]MEB0138592.1 Maf-like protein [Undibacterium sp. CCC2.1]MEB0171344.1 Maf-like protein [Undibacterium sp. CCC1.1]MEB0175356.1 Maf-like protein [Undibacterium sp. CCC3.4]MEB0214540.1 Maf-like protein [Undibacterium sp. 5I2]WPX43086.1 Maf-like protein [Undibacterium sp. CCC3.4]
MPQSKPSSKPHARLILASSSAYRRELLARLQLPFTSMAPELDETALPGETPTDTALRLARQKAEAIAAQLGHDSAALIIGSDQVATLDGIQIGKPGNHENALKQLQFMRGREVEFHTALCLLDTRSDAPYALQSADLLTRVRFRDLSDAELDAYLRLEQPYDCAGSAKNEGLGIAILAGIDSNDPTALTGLPLIALTDMLRAAGVRFFN